MTRAQPATRTQLLASRPALLPGFGGASAVSAGPAASAGGGAVAAVLMEGGGGGASASPIREMLELLSQVCVKALQKASRVQGRVYGVGG
eukprot:228764-Chlamydomonas_euryale.AAC.2